MSNKRATALLALVSVGLASAPYANAQRVVAPPAGTVARPATTQPAADSRADLAAANAEAAAILDAIQKDPALAGELARNPSGGGALLRSRGAVGSSTVEIGPTTDIGAERTYTITIKVKNITIIITIRI
jgi:hypothetical protein